MAKFSLKILRSLPAHERKLTWSTMLTLLRLLLVPVIVCAMIINYWTAAFILFCVAAISDVLDGFIARWFNEHTFLGACLDPIVDKLLVFSVFATLTIWPSPLLMIPRWFVVMLFIKECIIVLGAIGIYIVRGHVQIRPTRLGKLTACMQMLFIVWLFSCYFLSKGPVKLFYAFLTMVLFLLFSSLMQYIKIGMKQWRV